MLFNRKAAIAFAAGSLTMLQPLHVRAADAPITLQLGADNEPTHPLVARAIEAAAKTNRDTGGRLDIKVFPANALGSDTSMVSQIRSGAIALTQIPTEILGSVIPIAGMENIPFAFSTYKQAFDALDGPLGANYRSAAPAAGIYVFEKLWCSGFKQVINSLRPINSPADLKGLKLRIAPSVVELAMWKAFDASAVPLNFSETYSALQSHLMDGMSVPIVPIETSKYYEIQKYLAITNHVFSSFSIAANAEIWHKIPEELRSIAERNFSASAVQQRQDMVALDTTLQAKLRDQGLALTHPDPKPFRTIIRNSGLYSQWRDHFGASNWAFLEKAAGNLT